MGNRAVITTEDKKIGVYLHWHGSIEYVNAFLNYCKDKKFVCPSEDNYGWASLIKVVANTVGQKGTSVGVDVYENLDTNNGDNGVYIIKNWEIVGREFARDDEELEGFDEHFYDRILVLNADL